MSESSSDAESSCGWTIISNEGSDIETLGLENTLEYGTDPLESRPDVVAELQDPAGVSGGNQTLPYAPTEICEAGRIEERGTSPDDTLREETLEEKCSDSEAGEGAAGKGPVTLGSSSDHSDIVTLGDPKEDEHVSADGDEVAAAAADEFYLGTSSSSQYTFTAVETVFPVQQSVLTNSSSSEDELAGTSGTAVRRRRVRKNTLCNVAEPEEEVLDSPHTEEEEQEEEEEEEEVTGAQQVEQAPPAVPPPLHGHFSWTLNRCILLALVIAISMGFGHFYGTIQSQERLKIVAKNRVNELGVTRDLLHQHLRDQLFSSQEVEEILGGDLDEGDMVQTLTEIMDQVTQENEELRFKQVQIQAQRDDLVMKMKRMAEDKTDIQSEQQKLNVENQLLRSSLEHEEKSLLSLQEELRSLHTKIGDLEDRGASADSLLSENQRLKEQLEEERKLIRSFLNQREVSTAEAKTLRKDLDKERKIMEQLRKEMEQLSRQSADAEGEANSETEKLQSRLLELEKKLIFEQQRSDLWEKLYVETKNQAKGDTQPKVKKSKEGMSGKVKETFDAVKNSTKEFVHHHKEQIKKAKEAVKENLRKFSDSVKSTFRHFKDSASTLLNKARGQSCGRWFQERDSKEQWQHRAHRPHHRHPHKPSDSFFQSNHNTRKSGGKVQEDEDIHRHRAAPKGCSGVFDCAYQESMSLFNKAMEPIRADEFNQLLQSYLQQEVDHFRHWKDLEKFINNFFHNGVFIHDQMLFTDFVSGVEDYLEDMHEYHGLDDDVFEDLDEYVYRHFFGDAYSKNYGPRPLERPDSYVKEELRVKHQQPRKQQRSRPRPHRDRKWNRSGRSADRHVADVKIELGPMPFDPIY
ncbi:cell cycle progression protein 1-like [Lampris incognitus]|uniref:cell cycle progression protein 1-like n=1 Tax=Lampris incognitus TaxID=2546036 RepID=UPI0024B488A9|nr:cell cycle progression protein 1-like [Lampris incognitus]XP_056135412.1 cell cycle progression protein 1-like [Lampris incognitus]